MAGKLVSLYFSDSLYAKLKQLMRRAGHTQEHDVIACALAVYDLLWEAKVAGTTTVLRDQAGKEKDLLLR